jgi:signal transduction histidine kinase/CheY-like chemotaxis protein/HPt (histidine-containing phosphotransfer) domain-containing protein
MVMVMPLPFLVFINSLQKHRYRKILLAVSLLEIADFTIFFTLFVLGKVPLINSFIYAASCVLISIVVMFTTLIIDLKRRLIASYAFVAAGFAVLAVCGAVQIFVYQFAHNGVFSGLFLAVGLFGFMICSIIHTIKQLIGIRLEANELMHINQSKDESLANMSHEIRTPINAVLGMNEMILRESLDSRNSGDPAVRESFSNISEYSRNIESAGNNLLSIINDILDFSKIEAGKLDIMEERYQMSSVLNDLSNIIFFKAKEKGLDFTIDVDETLPDVLYGDEVRIRQIITNILNNAVKYTEKGSIRLTLRGDLQGPAVPGQTIRLTAEIEDTGVGIRKEDLDKLFTKFQRLDLNQNSTVEGTGLGLAITHSLLKMMGGSIDVKSEYGKGSVFTVTVPQKVLSAEPVGDFHTRFRKKVQETKAYTETFRAPGARILIVDDTKMNLTVAVGLLKSTMIRIDTAGGGEEGCKMALTTPYDLILMDQRMPKMDGVEALHIIRSQPGGKNHDTPVICLTADAVKGARERYIAEGFTDYLTKPVESGPLEEMLAAYLPPEKVIRMQVETPEPDARQSAEDGKYEPLRRAGIDTKSGLGYCQNDRDLYRSLLLEYAGSAQSKSEEIDRAYEAKDWRNYSIPVHSLKSSSRMIGATMLSGMAAELESAADDGRAYDISEGHVRMLRCYAETVQAIRETFRNEEENSPDGENEDEILEFLPDGD